MSPFLLSPKTTTIYMHIDKNSFCSKTYEFEILISWTIEEDSVKSIPIKSNVHCTSFVFFLEGVGG